jgi:hypothetical protein
MRDLRDPSRFAIPVHMPGADPKEPVRKEIPEFVLVRTGLKQDVAAIKP